MVYRRPSAPVLVPVVILLLLIGLSVAPSTANAQEAGDDPDVTAPAGEQDEAKGENENTDSGEKKKLWKKLFGGRDRAESRSAEPQESAQDSEDERAVRKEARQEERLERTAGVGSSSRQLGRVQVKLRNSASGQEPMVRRYLDLIDRNEADAAQIGAFANLLAERGLLDVASEYYREAIRRDPGNPSFWVNLGTIHRQTGRTTAAVAAYRKAIKLDPAHAVAYYNLGVAFDAQGKYDEAIAAYISALTLDPSLADATVNPQVVNNTNLPAVNLILYQRRAGNQTLPLIAVPGGELPSD